MYFNNHRYIIESLGIIMPEDIFYDILPSAGFSLDEKIISMSGCSRHEGQIAEFDHYDQAEQYFYQYNGKSAALWLPVDHVIAYFDPRYSSPEPPLFLVEHYLKDRVTGYRILRSDTSYDVMQGKMLLASSSNFNGAVSLSKEFSLSSDANLEIRFCNDIIVPIDLNEIKEAELNSASISDEPVRN